MQFRWCPFHGAAARWWWVRGRSEFWCCKPCARQDARAYSPPMWPRPACNEGVNTAVASVRKGGSVVLVGNVSAEVSLPLQKVVTRQIRLQGSCASAGEYPRAIELLSTGAIGVKPLITAV